MDRTPNALNKQDSSHACTKMTTSRPLTLLSMCAHTSNVYVRTYVCVHVYTSHQLQVVHLFTCTYVYR